MLIGEISSTENSLRALLDGSEINENAVIGVRPREGVPDRLQLLSAAVAGKNVVHLGFCDHLPSIEPRRRAGRWLHDHLIARANRCLGIDIDAKAVAFVRDTCKVDDVACVDICSEASRAVLGTSRWDTLLIPEVLEHIGNPVSFLKKIATLHRDSFMRVIITVPNAFRGGSITNALRGHEAINSDHRFYFTPYTIMKVAVDAGLTLESLSFARFTELKGVRGALKGALLRQMPMLSEDLVLTATL